MVYHLNQQTLLQQPHLMQITFKDKLYKESENFHFIRIKILSIGQTINNHYKIQQLIGEGTFALVYKAYDLRLNQFVCIKFIKNSGPKYMRVGQHEQSICKEILGINSSQQIITSFQYGNNMCLVFELLGPSLLNILTLNQRNGLPENIVTQFIYYLLISLKDLKDKQIIHADIKPANILTLGDPLEVNINNRTIILPQVLNLKLCDFGNAFYEYEQKPGIVQTQSYRAPEILLQDNYSYPIDIFSVGCVYYELLTGQKLFQCKSTLCQILLMQKYLQIDIDYILNIYIRQSKSMQICQLLQQFNRTQNKFIYRKGQITEEDEIFLKQALPIEQKLQQLNIREQTIQFVKDMLQFNPQNRITVEKALQNQIFYTQSQNFSTSKQKFQQNSEYNQNNSNISKQQIQVIF